MNNVQVNLDFDALKALGTNISTKAGEFKTILDNINKVNGDLNQYWQGADAENYKTTVEKYAAEMQTLQEVIAGCGERILSIHKAYKDMMDSHI